MSVANWLPWFSFLTFTSSWRMLLMYNIKYATTKMHFIVSNPAAFSVTDYNNNSRTLPVSLSCFICDHVPFSFSFASVPTETLLLFFHNLFPREPDGWLNMGLYQGVCKCLVQWTPKYCVLSAIGGGCYYLFSQKYLRRWIIQWTLVWWHCVWIEKHLLLTLWHCIPLQYDHYDVFIFGPRKHPIELCLYYLQDILIICREACLDSSFIWAWLYWQVFLKQSR